MPLAVDQSDVMLLTMWGLRGSGLISSTTVFVMNYNELEL